MRQPHPIPSSDAPAEVLGLDPLLVELARGQGGHFTTQQAATLGHSRFALSHWVESNLLDHPHRGLYGVRSLLSLSAETIHLQRCQGILLLYPDAVIGAIGSLAEHSVALWSVDFTHVVIHRSRARGHGVRGVTIRPPVDDAVDTDHGRVLPVARALVDLARDHGTIPAVVAADDALHRNLLGTDDLVETASPWLRKPKGSRVSALLQLVDGRSESVAESRTRCVLAAGGFEMVPQVEIRDGADRFVARVDGVIKGTKVVIEVDGKVKYASGDPEVLWREKTREDRIRALGYVVVRVTWADLENPGRLLAKVRAGVALAAKISA